MESGEALYGRAGAVPPARSAVLKAVAGWVPGEPVRNDALPTGWGVDDAWVRSRTGIGSRHRAGAGVSTGDLAYEAARRLIGPADDSRTAGGGAAARGGTAGAGRTGAAGAGGANGGGGGADGRAGLDAGGGGGAPGGVPTVLGGPGRDRRTEPAARAGTRSVVDAVVLATATPDHPCPATAPALAARLGLGQVPAFDIGAVCSGFVYGLAVCQGLIVSGLYDRVLLVGADAYSTWLDPGDRSTGVVFGDGAGAALIGAGGPGDPGELLAFDLGSDGTGYGLVTVEGGGSRARSLPGPAAEGDQYFRMSGQTVYQHAVERMTGSCRSLLRTVGWHADQVDHFVPHQANGRILRSVADRLGIGEERCVIHLDRVGNTGAASLPLALADGAARERFRAGDRMLLTAFGGGLTWGTAALRWPETWPEA
ncbi:beta-ketoacyl-ACP synthase 3 [Streptomyces sp. NPDC088258]|uniref:beta-ketoacyl-ACP synthase 3 n=1 Tax=Streptomyces sp. NPDC088258 TaxID=3365849 RepID=UPI00381DE890